MDENEQNPPVPLQISKHYPSIHSCFYTFQPSQTSFNEDLRPDEPVANRRWEPRSVLEGNAAKAKELAEEVYNRIPDKIGPMAEGNVFWMSFSVMEIDDLQFLKDA